MVHRRSRGGLQVLIAEHSDAIRVCRVLCIVTVAYVHVSVGEADSSVGAAVQAVFRGTLGRSSIALLSAVSGLLMVRVFQSRSFVEAMRGRATGLLVPLVVWNAIALGVMWALQRPLPTDLLDGLTAARGHGVNRPLTFLRDLFLVSALTPVLVTGIRRLGLWLLIPLVLAGGFVSTKPVIAHSQIVAYFALGVGFGVLELERLRLVRAVGRCMPWMLAAVVGLSVVRSQGSAVLAFMDTNAFDALVRRPVCAGAFWVLSMRLARWTPLRGAIVRWVEPAIFAMFLSHAIVLQLLGSAVEGAMARAPTWAWAVWLPLPFVALGFAIAAHQCLLRLPEVLHRLLLGKEKPSTRDETE